jgi:hypothetical protein
MWFMASELQLSRFWKAFEAEAWIFTDSNYKLEVISPWEIKNGDN